MGNGLGIMLGGGISGSNYVFSEQTWVSLGGYIVGEAAGDESGISVSLSSDGTIVAIGAWQMMEMALLLVMLGCIKMWEVPGLK
jgi:hypothetical protein